MENYAIEALEMMGDLLDEFNAWAEWADYEADMATCPYDDDDIVGFDEAELEEAEDFIVEAEMPLWCFIVVG